jgi:hypothetical protein
MAEGTSAPKPITTGQKLLVALAWAYVGIPLLWGITQTAIKSAALFR